MTTMLSLITDALQEIGIIDEYETPNAADSAKALRLANALLDSWSLDNLTIFVQNNYTYTLIPGQATYTIGATPADFIGPRFNEIDGGFVTYQGVDFPFELIDNQTYNDIPLKTQQGQIMQAASFNNNFPLSSITFWPVPIVAIPVTLLSNQIFTTPATLTTILQWPSGYDRAFIKTLALELCPSYGKEASPTLEKLALMAMRAIRRNNKRSPISRYDPAITDDRANGVWNWIYM